MLTVSAALLCAAVPGAAQQQGALAQGQANYHRAFRACMEGRGYTVR